MIPFLKKIDYCGIIIIVILATVDSLYYLIEPFHPEFFEGDPTISRPYHDSTVGDVILYLYSLILPLFVVICLTLIIPRITDKIKLPSLQRSVISLIQTVFVAVCVTDYLKAYCGRLRPNFFSACHYPYNETTGVYGVMGMRGDYSKCNCSKSELAELRRSFPSGHSSYSCAGLSFTSLFIFMILNQIYENRQTFLKILFSSIPLLGGFLIAGSRPKDNKHHFSDIVAGTVLGVFIGFVVFYTTMKREEESDKEKEYAVLIDNEQPPTSTSGTV